MERAIHPLVCNNGWMDFANEVAGRQPPDFRRRPGNEQKGVRGRACARVPPWGSRGRAWRGERAWRWRGRRSARWSRPRPRRSYRKMCARSWACLW